MDFNGNLSKSERFRCRLQDSAALRYAHEELRSDRSFVLDAVRRNAEVLPYVPDALQEDPDFMLEAVSRNYRVLKLANKGLRRVGERKDHLRSYVKAF